MSGDDHGNELVDAALRDEIALVGDLVVAAGDSDDHLSQTQIDEILGVEADDETPAEGPGPTSE